MFWTRFLMPRINVGKIWKPEWSIQHLPSSLPDRPDRQQQVHRDMSLKSLGLQPARILPVPNAWAVQCIICVPALSWAICPAEWSALDKVPATSTICAPWSRQATPGSQRQPEYNIAWSKAHQGSNGTQEWGNPSAICARGNPGIQWCKNSLTGSQEVQAPASNRTN